MKNPITAKIITICKKPRQCQGFYLFDRGDLYFHEWLTVAAFLEIPAFCFVSNNNHLVSPAFFLECRLYFCARKVRRADLGACAVILEKHLIKGDFCSFFEFSGKFFDGERLPFRNSVLFPAGLYNREVSTLTNRFSFCHNHHILHRNKKNAICLIPGIYYVSLSLSPHSLVVIRDWTLTPLSIPIWGRLHCRPCFLFDRQGN